MDNSIKYCLFFILLVIIVFIGGIGWVQISFATKMNNVASDMVEKVEEIEKEKQMQKEETLANGIETQALVVDKEVYQNTRTNTNVMPMMVNRAVMPMPISSTTMDTSEKYTLRLYAIKEDFNVTVSKEIYDSIEQGDYIEVIVHNDYVLLQTLKENG